MLTVHHLQLSQSERIVWLCEELEIAYRLVNHARDPQTRMAPAEYKALHPFGTAPVITDGDLVLGESTAIMDYIIGRHGGGRLAVAPEASNFPDYLYWYHFANGSLMPAISAYNAAVRSGTIDPKAPKHPFMARDDLAHAMLDARLAQVPWLAGDELTAADIATVFVLTTLRLFMPRDLSPYPNILAYLQRVGARPAYRRAMAKGDPGLEPLLA